MTWATHLLLLEDDVSPQELEALALSRIHQVYRPDAGTLAWGGGVTCVGPRRRSGSDDVPSWVGYIAEFTVPAERGGRVPPELRLASGVLAAFPEGEPIGRERETLDTAMAFARRLGGAVRTSTGTIVTAPALADLLVFSDRWLAEERLRIALAPFIDARRDEPVTAPSSPSVPHRADHGLDAAYRRWLHAEADAFDAYALEHKDHPGQDPLTPYSIHADRADGGLIVVTVDHAPVTPIAVDSTDWSEPVVYELRYYPPTGHQAGAEKTRAASEAATADAMADPAVIAVIENCAWAISTAVGGPDRAVVCDDDAFLVNLT